MGACCFADDRPANPVADLRMRQGAFLPLRNELGERAGVRWHVETKIGCKTPVFDRMRPNCWFLVSCNDWLASFND